MYQCSNCQAELAANAQFCARCGTPVEESQTRSADLDEASTGEAALETTSKLQAVTTPPAAPAPTLPTLRTRRMHPQSSIPTFPQDPWLPGSAENEDGTTVANPAREEPETLSPAIHFPLTLPDEPVQDASQAQEEAASSALSAPLLADASNEPTSYAQTELAQSQESSAPASLSQAGTIAQDDPDASTPVLPDNSSDPAIDASDALSAPTESAELPIEALDTVALPTTTPAEVATGASSGESAGADSMQADAEISAARAENTQTTEKETEASPVSASEQPLRQAQVGADAPGGPDASGAAPMVGSSVSPAEDLTYVPAFPPPAPERMSTPRPATPLPPSVSRPGKRSRGGRTLVVVLIVVLIMLAGGAGAFAFVRLQASPGTSSQCNAQQTNCPGGTSVAVQGKATSLAFSGKVTGPMSIVAKPSCQNATSGSLRTLTVTLSGTINDHLYNFGFAIARYNGPGSYSNATASVTILFDVPGESTTNGWGNSAATDTGSITVERGEQTGNISYTLSGVGTQAGSQIQVSGNWTCGK